MGNTNQEKASLLNELVQINNDRIEGYSKAIEILEKNDYGLQEIFEKYRDQSIQFKNELTPLITREGEVPTQETRVTGKIFRAWMELKSSVSSVPYKSVLESCEKGEDEFKKVYANTIQEVNTLAPDLVTILQSQLDIQLQAHDHIKELRDNTQ